MLLSKLQEVPSGAQRPGKHGRSSLLPIIGLYLLSATHSARSTSNFQCAVKYTEDDHAGPCCTAPTGELPQNRDWKNLHKLIFSLSSLTDQNAPQKEVLRHSETIAFCSCCCASSTVQDRKAKAVDRREYAVSSQGSQRMCVRQ